MKSETEDQFFDDSMDVCIIILH